MLDLKWVRENPDRVRKALQDRLSKFPFDDFLALDQKCRSLRAELEKLQAKRNADAQEIGKAKAAKGDVSRLLEEVETIKTGLKALEKELGAVEPQLEDLALRLSNLPLGNVPIGKGSEDNRVLREVGHPRTFAFEPRPHWEVGEALGVLDFQTAAKVSGTRFAVLRGQGAALERALITFMMDLHTREHGYTEVFLPYLVARESMQGTGQLPRFEEELYRCRDDELYLIPTAEVSVTNLHREEVLNEKDLPRKYVCCSACFRREAGSYGKDTRGLIRNHQFNKVELVQFVKPEDSLSALELLTAHAEKVLYRLGLPYRVVELCTADLGFAAAKTYDLEVWMPGEKRWREISSCSTFTDFQARRIHAKVQRGDGKKEFLHTLNGSGVAVGRTFAAILENFQEKDGSVTIPELLRPYTGFDRLEKL